MRILRILPLVFLALVSRVIGAHAGPNDYAIVIANQTYGQGMPAVTFAANDARAFAKAAADVLRVPAANIIRVNDASLGRFFEIFGNPGRSPGLIDSLVQSPDARLYVYYSGHGLPVMEASQPQPYLLPVDASAIAPQATGYGLADLIQAVRRAMKNAPQGKAVIFIDACFSGVSDGGALLPDTSAGNVPVILAPVSDLAVLTASSDRELAHWDRPRTHGLFTDALLNGLYGAADEASAGGNGDMRITLGELDSYVARRMSGRLRELHPGRIVRQRPTMRGPADMEIASFATGYVERDPRARISEDRECSYLASFGTPADIDGFLQRCVHCACRSALEARRAKQSQIPLDCEAEQPTWTRIQQRGNMDEIQWMAKNATCPAIRSAAMARVEAALAKEDEDRRKRDDERRRLEEEQRKRLNDERLKLEDERRRLDESSIPPAGISQRVTQFIELEYLRDQEHFADRVDYYDKGIVSRDFIASDRQKYAARWPVRQYRLVPGTLAMTRRSASEYVVTFAYTFAVANGANRRQGRGSTQVGLRDTGNGFLVVSVKEVVHR